MLRCTTLLEMGPKLGEWTLHAATIIAGIQCATKFLELSLDSGQQQKVQQVCDRLTLLLIDLNVLKWLYPKLAKRRTQLTAYLATAAVCIAAAVVIVTYREHLTLADFTEPEAEDLAWLIGGITGVVVVYFPYRVLLAWFARSSTPSRFAAKAFSLYAIGFTTVPIVRMSHSTIVFYCLLPVMIMAGLSAWCGAIIVLLRLAQFVVWFFSQVMWRISTYAQGAWAAVIIMIAGSLGAAELWLKLHK